MSHEREVRTAFRRARATLPPRDRAVFAELIDCAEWQSAEILPRWQPRSLVALAGTAGLAKSTLVLSLDHLELHQWVTRRRAATPGRGHATAYQVRIGVACDCPDRASLADPVPDAERMRRYRARRKASGAAVTKVSEIHVTPSLKGSEIHVTKGPSERNETAGQPPVSAKEGTKGKVVEGDELFPTPPSRAERGPCATCRQPCARYGPGGRPLCDPCEAAAIITAKLPDFPASWAAWPPGSIGEFENLGAADPAEAAA